MNSWHYITVIFLQWFCCTASIAQQNGIDSLKQILPDLNDTGRIDCLNKLSSAFVFVEKEDSAGHYANLAYNESKKINYVHGIAVSYIRKARIAKHFADDFILSERLAQQSLMWYEKTANKEGLFDVYYELFYAVVPQSRFAEGAEYANKMYELSNEKGDEAGMCEALQRIAAAYKNAGDYEKSFDYYLRLRQFAEKTKNKYHLSCSLFGLGQLYMKIEDYSTALKHFREAFQMDTPEYEAMRRREDWDIWVKMEYAEIFSHLKLFDSAAYYFALFKPLKEVDTYHRIYLVSMGEYFFLQKKYDPALENFLQALAFHRKLNDQNEIQRTLILIAETYFAKADYASAMRFGKEALHVAHQTRAKQILRDGYQVMYTVYDRLHQSDSANYYFRHYTAMKESVANDQVKARFAVFGYEQKISLLDKEKQLQDQRLAQTNQQKKFLIAGLVFLFIAGFVFFRNLILKRKNEKLRMQHVFELQQVENEKSKIEFQQQATELEMQALRAQMNPHFIFNSLNSINRFILQNNKSHASEYLTKFSKLVRLILQNSQASLITLESELEALKLYLELEALRFEQHFDYTISVAKDLDIDILRVPPLIIQPYAENAIWHGLMHKDDKGKLEIEILEEDSCLLIKITDNGIGRKKARELASKSTTKHKSLGLKITADRVAMLHTANENNSPVTINDLVHADGGAAGTEVVIRLPVLIQ